jgi:hypothetical protein
MDVPEIQPIAFETFIRQVVTLGVAEVDDLGCSKATRTAGIILPVARLMRDKAEASWLNDDAQFSPKHEKGAEL